MANRSMGRLKDPNDPVVKETVRQIEKKKKEMANDFEHMNIPDKLDFLTMIGVGKDYFTCQYCGKVKVKSDFYVSTEPNNATGVTRICKACVTDIAIPTVSGKKQQPNKSTVDDALRFLNKPYLEVIWEASLLEAANTASGQLKNSVWGSYIKNVQMKNYYGLTYKESDNYTGGTFSLEDMKEDSLPKDQEIIEQFEKNKNDVLRLLGYLPFEKEKLSDQPFLYSQLVGFLDASEEGNDDMMRVQSIISIVRGFLQTNQIDDMIADLVKDPRNAEKNIATVRALQDMKKNITQSITKLAEQSCISLKNSKTNTKGLNTWTGKIKQIKDMNFRSAQVNGFDIMTCKGMQQVQEISDASIMKQLALDESEWSDMVAEMRTENQRIRRDLEKYKEINRILLQENLDLKDFYEEQGFMLSDDTVNLKDLYSPFGFLDGDDEGVGSDETNSPT